MTRSGDGWDQLQLRENVVDAQVICSAKNVRYKDDVPRLDWSRISRNPRGKHHSQSQLFWLVTGFECLRVSGFLALGCLSQYVSKSLCHWQCCLCGCRSAWSLAYYCHYCSCHPPHFCLCLCPGHAPSPYGLAQGSSCSYCSLNLTSSFRNESFSLFHLICNYSLPIVSESVFKDTKYNTL